MIFREYQQSQGSLFPSYISEWVPEGDLVRLVDLFVMSLPEEKLEYTFERRDGAPAYHPRMMMKVILYAYTQKCYSCRSIAKALRKDIYFMWLSGRQLPNFNTINRFRSVYLAKAIELALPALFSFLLENGIIKNEDIFVDGTKIEADAGKNSFVWKKNSIRFKKAVQKRCLEIIQEANSLNDSEEIIYGGKDLPETGEDIKLSSEEIRQAAAQVGVVVKKSEDPNKKKLLLSRQKKLELEAGKCEGYEKQLSIAGERSSYSKTDKDATFFRLKNGLLRPGYNLQYACENGFITSLFVGQSANDASSLPPLIAKRLSDGLALPQTLTADAGYGHEQIYENLETAGVEAFIKYPDYSREKKGKKKPYERANFEYQKAEDLYICPEKKSLVFSHEHKVKTRSGYEMKSRVYSSDACLNCQVKKLCTNAPNRTIQRNENLERHKQLVRERLSTEKGEELRKRRAWEAETPFAQLKRNMGKPRTSLRGLKKVTTEMAFLAMGMNLKRLHNLM